MAAIKHTHKYARPGETDILLGFLTRTADTDGLYQWNGSGWTLLWELEGTDLIYDSATYQGRVYWVDGKHHMWVYDAYEDTVCEIETSPLGLQYLLVYQDRLVGAGDARTEAEVVADSGTWPVDSNRDRVLFSEALDVSRWSPNNFIDANSGTGELISGLGVNSITSADRGAQSQLVVFKPSATLVNDGVLGAAEQRLNIVSSVIGCPGYHSIVNTPFGLMFCSKTTVCLLDTSGKEPQQVGFWISPAIAEVPADLQKWTAAIFHDNTYKLALGSSSATTANDREWWLDLRPQIFPQEHIWYGPMTGDAILQYEIFKNLLVGAQMETTNMWRLDVEGTYRSMTTTAARTSTMTWPRIKSENMARGKLDAYGFRGVIDADTAVAFIETVDFERGEDTEANTFTVPANPAIYNVTRPVKRNSYDAQVSISHSAASDLEVHSVYVRGKVTRRQSEKMDGSTQT
jgi:hypothetical protein